MRRLLAMLDRFGPRAGASGEALRRARVLAGIALGNLAAIAIEMAAATTHELPSPTLLAVAAAAIAGYGLVLVLLRRGPTTDAASHVLCLTLLSAMGFAGLHRDGTAVISSPWLLAAPLIANYLLGVRGSAVYGAAVVAEILLTILIHHLGWVIDRALLPRDPHVLLAVTAVTAIPAICFFAMLDSAARADAERRLARELDTRLRMEADLRQAQKLESVGRLAAGVAHEINTPVQFVSDSIHFLRDANLDIMSVVDKLQAVQRSVLDGAPSRAAAEDAAACEDEADLPYLRDQMPEAFERSLDGLARVATIVRSMKEFSHPDSTEKTSIDLNRAIESTLVIARNEYKYVADVVTDLGALPPVMCYPGDINQVILNIVVNAAHAIGDVVAGTDAHGTITVRTRAEGGDVVISIGDTGGGIPAAIRDKVFDPFFTTKAVGRGTGQGLAIAWSVVVDKHGGTVGFDTEPGRGTTFHIRLPLHPRPAALAA